MCCHLAEVDLTLFRRSAEANGCQRKELDYLLEFETDSFDPCVENFEHRFVVGVNDAKPTLLKKIASSPENVAYVKISALQHLLKSYTRSFITLMMTLA